MAALAEIPLDFFKSPHDYPPKWLFMLTAYLDETGHESKDYVFIAGFLGNDEQWNLCAREWKAALGNRSGLHMANLHWAHPRTARLLANLGPIPRQCGLEPMVGGVRVSDYSDMKLGWSGLKLARGYINALFPLVIQALRSIPKNERLELVFEQQDEYEPVASMVLSEAARVPDAEFKTDTGLPKLAKWSFVPKSSTMLPSPPITSHTRSHSSTETNIPSAPRYACQYSATKTPPPLAQCGNVSKSGEILR